MLHDVVDVKSKGDEGVKDVSQDIASLHREWVTFKEDARVDVKSMGVGGEEGGVHWFCERDGQQFASGPFSYIRGVVSKNGAAVVKSSAKDGVERTEGIQDVQFEMAGCNGRAL